MNDYTCEKCGEINYELTSCPCDDDGGPALLLLITVNIVGFSIVIAGFFGDAILRCLS